MALKIRLQRRGNTHRPIYKIVVAEAACRRDGKFVEALGNYNPQARGQDKELVIDIERAEYWTSVGAQPTETVKSLIKRAKKEAVA